MAVNAAERAADGKIRASEKHLEPARTYELAPFRRHASARAGQRPGQQLDRAPADGGNSWRTNWARARMEAPRRRSPHQSVHLLRRGHVHAALSTTGRGSFRRRQNRRADYSRPWSYWRLLD